MQLQEVGDSFDLIHEGKFFQEVWEHEKRKNTFNWNNRSSKHDAYQVHEYGQAVGAGLVPTSREKGSAMAMNIKMTIMDEERKNGDKSSDAKSKAVNKREKPKQAAAGMSDADKKEQEDIERAIRESMKDLNVNEDSQKDKTKKPQKKNDDDGFGLSSAFEDFSTYNGKAVGAEGGPQTSVSMVNMGSNETTSTKNGPNSQKQPDNSGNQFDFNFDAPNDSNSKPQTNEVDIDDLLGSTKVEKSSSFIQKQVDVFQFDQINNQNDQNQFFVNGISNQQQQQQTAQSNDPFNFDNIAVNNPAQQQQQWPPAQDQNKPK